MITRTPFICATAIWLFQIASRGAVAQLPDDPPHLQQWERNRQAEIAADQTKPPEEAIPLLGAFVGQLTRPVVYREAEEKDRIIRQAQAALISIPGHADYYAARIREARQTYDDYHKNEDERANLARSHLYNEQTYGFETLGHLPSPETVRVLGEFLDDERGRLPIESKVHDGPDRAEAPLDCSAVRAMMTLPIVSKPFSRPLKEVYTDGDFDAMLSAWRLWYAQVKAGTRTFRFEGDPTEYNLNGPVRISSADAGSHSIREGPAVAVTTSTSPPSNTKSLLLLGGSVAILAAGGWYAFRQKKSAL